MESKLLLSPDPLTLKECDDCLNLIVYKKIKLLA